MDMVVIPNGWAQRVLARGFAGRDPPGRRIPEHSCERCACARPCRACIAPQSAPGSDALAPPGCVRGG
eukprot:113945-Chlamydomonas_euryale.AAC.7